MKRITGADKQTCRGMFGFNITFKPQCLLGVLCNIMPQFYDASKAMPLRNRVINFPFCFGNGVEDFDRPADANLAEKLMAPNYKRALISMLSKYYVKYFSNTIEIKDIPKSVVEATEEYNNENDPISSWFSENYEKGDDKVLTVDIYNEFLSDTGTSISQIKFNQTIDKKLGFSKQKIGGKTYFVKLRKIVHTA